MLTSLVTYILKALSHRTQHALRWPLTRAKDPNFVLCWPLCSACTSFFCSRFTCSKMPLLLVTSKSLSLTFLSSQKNDLFKCLKISKSIQGQFNQSHKTHLLCVCDITSLKQFCSVLHTASNDIKSEWSLEAEHVVCTGPYNLTRFSLCLIYCPPYLLRAAWSNFHKKYFM